MASGYASILDESHTAVQVGPPLSTQAWPEGHDGLHMLEASVGVHTLVELTHASLLAQNEPRQGVVSETAASSKVHEPAAGLASALVATRTLEMSAPPLPPGAMDWYAMTNAPLRKSILA